jgi:hypothetical protein
MDNSMQISEIHLFVTFQQKNNTFFKSKKITWVHKKQELVCNLRLNFYSILIIGRQFSFESFCNFSLT